MIIIYSPEIAAISLLFVEFFRCAALVLSSTISTSREPLSYDVNGCKRAKIVAIILKIYKTRLTFNIMLTLFIFCF